MSTVAVWILTLTVNLHAGNGDVVTHSAFETHDRCMAVAVRVWREVKEDTSGKAYVSAICTQRTFEVSK